MIDKESEFFEYILFTPIILNEVGNTRIEMGELFP